MIWWKKSLAGQFVVFMLAALFVGQTIAFLISSGQREAEIRQTVESDFINRTAALSSVLDSVAADMRRNVLIASSTGYARFWMSDHDPLQDETAWHDVARSYLSLSVSDLIKSQNLNGGEITALGNAVTALPHKSDVTAWQRLQSEPGVPNAHFLHFSDREGMGIVQPFGTASWLNAAYYKPTPPNLLSTQSMLSIGITAIILSLIGIVVAYQIARPLRRLAVSAEAMGRGEAIQLSAPSAPDDIQQLYEAFDRMQIRLRRFVDDRTRMLAAIGHDLRTPLTTLRLRAEFINDRELQCKILATIDEMQAMTEATLSFAKSDATVEETRSVDLAALIGSLCDDLAELGHEVIFEDSDRISYRCRPDNLKRAVRNLIENALRYAGSATVKVQVGKDTIEISIEDSGPGIPACEYEQVFAPFYRIENSRNRETGGIGLGLSIARAVARHHGGDVVLTSNNPGLRVSMILPLA